MDMTRPKDQAFGFVNDRIKNKLHSWRNKFLSSARKNVMLKVVIMAMSTYAKAYISFQQSFAMR